MLLVLVSLLTTFHFISTQANHQFQFSIMHRQMSEISVNFWAGDGLTPIQLTA